MRLAYKIGDQPKAISTSDSSPSLQRFRSFISAGRPIISDPEYIRRFQNASLATTIETEAQTIPDTKATTSQPVD